MHTWELRLPTFYALARRARAEAHSAVREGTPAQKRERVRAIAIALVLPLALMGIAGSAAGALLPVFFFWLVFAAPALVVFRIFVPWVLGERSLLAGLRENLAVPILGPIAGPISAAPGFRTRRWG